MTYVLKAALFVCAISAVSIPACADTILVTFEEPTIDVVPNETDIAVSGTFTNTDPADPVYLNADNINLPAQFDVTDEFFTNVPIFLTPSQTTGPIELFRFSVAAGTPVGSYAASYDLLGGVGTANQFNFDPLTTAPFTVFVTPEPAPLILLGAALVALGSMRRRRSGSSYRANP